MRRMSGALVALLGVTAVSTRAHAQDSGPYMWGIGPKIGTLFIPGHYPFAFPSSIANYDFKENGPLAGNPDGNDPKRDLDEEGKPRNTTLEGVGGDFRFGGEGFYGLDAENRLGAGVGVAGGKNYLDYWFTLNYDRRLWGDAPFDLVAGVQIGYGRARWDGDEEKIGGENESLAMTNYPIRIRLEGQFRDKVRMYGLGIFVQDAVPANTTYTDLDGVVQDSVGGFGNFALNFAAGIELDVQFGDFTPPKKKKKGGKAGAGNRKPPPAQVKPGGGSSTGGGKVPPKK